MATKLALVFITLYASLLLCNAVRHGPAHRKVSNPFSKSKCIVHEWPECMNSCPNNSTVPAVMMGKNGAIVGSFLPAPIQAIPNQSIENCCKACAEYNYLNFNNIFGYLCDFWSWRQVQGFSGKLFFLFFPEVP